MFVVITKSREPQDTVNLINIFNNIPADDIITNKLGIIIQTESLMTGGLGQDDVLMSCTHDRVSDDTSHH